jgi:hypothetical protein
MFQVKHHNNDVLKTGKYKKSILQNVRLEIHAIYSLLL